MIGVNKSDIGQFADFGAKNPRRNRTSAKGLFAMSDTLLLLFVVIALMSAITALLLFAAVLLNAIPGFLGSYSDGWPELYLLPFAGGWGVTSAVVLGMNGMLFALLARSRIVHNQSTYVEAGCPHCYELRLMRIRRRKRDRLVRLIGLPAWRYACQFCTWQGLRLKGDVHPAYGNVIVGAEVEKGSLELIESERSAGSANGDYSIQPLLAVDFAVDPEAKHEVLHEAESVAEGKDNAVDFARLCLEVVRAKK